MNPKPAASFKPAAMKIVSSGAVPARSLAKNDDEFAGLFFAFKKKSFQNKDIPKFDA